LVLRVFENVNIGMQFGKMLDKMLGEMLGELDALMILLARD
jgi:hypothetical protein